MGVPFPKITFLYKSDLTNFSKHLRIRSTDSLNYSEKQLGDTPTPNADPNCSIGTIVEHLKPSHIIHRDMAISVRNKRNRWQRQGVDEITIRQL